MAKKISKNVEVTPALKYFFAKLENLIFHGRIATKSHLSRRLIPFSAAPSLITF